MLSEEGGLGRLGDICFTRKFNIIKFVVTCGTIFHLSGGVKGRESQDGLSSVLIPVTVPNALMYIVANHYLCQLSES